MPYTHHPVHARAGARKTPPHLAMNPNGKVSVIMRRRLRAVFYFLPGVKLAGGAFTARVMRTRSV